MKFEFVTAGRIIFGSGTAAQLGDLCRPLGARPLFIHGGGGAKPDSILDVLEKQSLPIETFLVEGEPTVEMIRSGQAKAVESGCDLVIGYGGGSVIDAAKAVAAMAANPGDVLDYLEVIGAGKSIPNPPLPVIAVPTTAGTGSEVTRNAVIRSEEHQFKASLRSPLMLPRVALIDPALTCSLPPAPTASTGMDALTQVLEPYVSTRTNPMTDGFCREGLALAASAIRDVYHNGDDLADRERMAAASLLGGLSLANAGLGAVHGFAAPIGGMYPAPHGVVCARLLAPVVAANIRSLQASQPASPVLGRYLEISRILTGNPAADLGDGVKWLDNITRELEIPRLASYGVQAGDIPELVTRAMQASSMKANPVTLTRDELTQILEISL